MALAKLKRVSWSAPARCASGLRAPQQNGSRGQATTTTRGKVPRSLNGDRGGLAVSADSAQAVGLLVPVMTQGVAEYDESVGCHTTVKAMDGLPGAGWCNPTRGIRVKNKKAIESKLSMALLLIHFQNWAISGRVHVEI